MLPCLVNSRPQLRRSSQSLGLLPLSPHILTSLLLYLLFQSSRDEKPVTASPLESALTNCDAPNPFRIRFYENCRVACAPVILFPIFRTFFQVPYPVSTFLAALTKTAGVCTNNSQSGTPSGPLASAGHPSPVSLLPLLCELCVLGVLCVKSFFFFQPSTFNCRPLRPVSASWLSFTPSDKIASLPAPRRQMDRANEDSP
jgi:hypothetical protein